MMTASIGMDRSYSIFTMALLQDSGWYIVNFNLADDFTWG